jgi:hypothetical protein
MQTPGCLLFLLRQNFLQKHISIISLRFYQPKKHIPIHPLTGYSQLLSLPNCL